jgi:hypothetical protein
VRICRWASSPLWFSNVSTTACVAYSLRKRAAIWTSIRIGSSCLMNPPMNPMTIACDAAETSFMATGGVRFVWTVERKTAMARRHLGNIRVTDKIIIHTGCLEDILLLRSPIVRCGGVAGSISIAGASWRTDTLACLTRQGADHRAGVSAERSFNSLRTSSIECAGGPTRR